MSDAAMTAMPWILEVLILVLLGIAAVVVIRKKEKKPTDYRTFFIIGLIWLPIGVANVLMERSFGTGSFFLIMGVAYLVIGLANRDKWHKQEETTPQARKKMMIIVTGLAALVGLLTLLPHLLQLR